MNKIAMSDVNESIHQNDELASAQSPRHHLKRWILRLVVVGSLVVLSTIGFFLWGMVGQPKGIQERRTCCHTLRLVYVGVRKYVDENGELPLDENGKLALNKISAKYSDEVRFTACQGDLDSSYLTNPDLSAVDLVTLPPRIIVCDRPSNHVLRYANGLRYRGDDGVQIQANLLLSNGDVTIWYGGLKTYETWVSEFLRDGSTFPPGVLERIEKSTPIPTN